MKTAGIPARAVGAVGLSGYGNGLHVLDKVGTPLRNAITSMDHRALPFLGTIPEDVQEWLRQATLQHLWEAQPGILLRWIKEFELDQYKKIAHILFCKDWIRFNLTGALGTEYSDISGGGLLNNTTRRYEMSILEALGIPEAFDCLPEIHASTTVVGKITPQAANCTGLLSGTPVVSGLFDVVANPIGSGLTAPGRLCSIMGTWNINVALSENPVIPTKIRQCTIFGDDRYYACIDSSTTSASNLEWVLKNVLHGSIGYEEFESIISHYKSGDLTLQFMPFLHGGLRPGNPGAAFIGLNSEHTQADMLRAVAEGIAFAHAYHVENLKMDGLQGTELLLTGGASRNTAWCQLMADIIQIPVRVPLANETGALGACVVAGVGAGFFQDIQDGVERMVKNKAVYEPQLAAAPIYQRKYKRFMEILDWMSQ